MTSEETIIEEWDRVRAPKAPELAETRIKLKQTALLVLDIQNNNCNKDRRPRCVQKLHIIQLLLEKARRNEMMVVFTLTSSASRNDIKREVFPLKEETIIKAGVDKFFQTDLEGILKNKKIKTVIITGTSAHGAVLHTATGAVARGFEVIVPVDGMTSTYPYEEQYTAWHLMNSPGTRKRVILTKAEMIHFA